VDTVLNFILSLNVKLLLVLILCILLTLAGATAVSHIMLDNKLSEIERLLAGEQDGT